MFYKPTTNQLRLVTASTTGDKQIDRRLVRLIRDPVEFAKRVLGHKVWHKQAEILTAVDKHPLVAVKLVMHRARHLRRPKRPCTGSPIIATASW